MVFDHDDYREYLKAVLAGDKQAGSKSGARARLARYLKCQTSFISQVLNGRSHFSLEHAIQVSDFLNHSGEERHFFMLLVQCERAGFAQPRTLLPQADRRATQGPAAY